MKLDEILATVTESILANGGTKELAAKTVKDIQKIAADEKEDRKASAGKRAKHDFAILVSDPEGVLKDKQLVGWCFQIEADGNPASLPERVRAVAEVFNSSRRGRRMPVNTIGETIQNAPAKYWKTDDGKTTRVKTKNSVYVIGTENTLPK